jgi:hypothetical protein
MATRPRLNLTPIDAPDPRAVLVQPAPEPEPPKAAYVAKSRIGRHAVSVYVDAATKRQLETICFNERAKQNHVMLEALDMLFSSRQMTRTATEGAAVPRKS